MTDNFPFGGKRSKLRRIERFSMFFFPAGFNFVLNMPYTHDTGIGSNNCFQLDHGWSVCTNS